MVFDVRQDQIYTNALYTSFYDLEMDGFIDDLKFYKKHLLLKNNSILELGCGTGRLSRALSQCGHSVVGVDLSYSMLQGARQKEKQQTSASPHYLCMDMSQLALSRRFDTIIIPFNTINLLTPEQVAQTLKLCRNHLKDKGQLLAQIFIPDDHLIQMGNSNKKQFQFKVYDLADGSKVIKEILKGYGPATGLVDITERYRLRFRPDQPNEDWQYHYQVLGYDAYKWEKVFIQSGFKVTTSYGDNKLADVNQDEHGSLFLAAVLATI